MPLINCKIHLELNWSKDCVMSTIADTIFKITNSKLYLPIVTLSSKDNVKLVKLLEEGFKRPVYWNEYQTEIETRNLDINNLTRFPLDASVIQLGDCLFFLLITLLPMFLMFQVLRNSHTKYSLPRVAITSYNVLIDERNVYDQLINNFIKQYKQQDKGTIIQQAVC